MCVRNVFNKIQKYPFLLSSLTVLLELNQETVRHSQWDKIIILKIVKTSHSDSEKILPC